MRKTAGGEEQFESNSDIRALSTYLKKFFWKSHILFLITLGNLTTLTKRLRRVTMIDGNE